MPRQNRVTPAGDIIATPARGTMMGNRGVLHDAAGHIRRLWQLKRWIVCVLEFRGRKRTVMAPGRYTELFFLDEAAALAAGHRPCAECRHARYVDFCNAWGTATGKRPTAEQIDARLHAERLSPNRSKRMYHAELDALPDGVMVSLDRLEDGAYLLWRAGLLRWSFDGYTKRLALPNGATVSVLTPPATVAAIRAGYVPDVHVSAVTARTPRPSGRR
jgi:hypothetical protein